VTTSDNLETKQKRGAGRPKVDEHIKLQRRVFRAYIKLERTKVLANLRNQHSISSSICTLGIQYSEGSLRYQMDELRNYELLHNLPQVEIEEVLEAGDPIVNDDFETKVGRKKNCELDQLDAKLRENDRIIKRIENEKPRKAVVREDGRGRPVSTKEERIRKLKIKKELNVAEIERLEKLLDPEAKVDRMLKKSRDTASKLKRELNKFDGDDDAKRELVILSELAAFNFSEIAYLKIRIKFQVKLENTIKFIDHEIDVVNASELADMSTKIKLNVLSNERSENYQRLRQHMWETKARIPELYDEYSRDGS
jgi:hypothetical protein